VENYRSQRSLVSFPSHADVTVTLAVRLLSVKPRAMHGFVLFQFQKKDQVQVFHLGLQVNLDTAFVSSWYI